MGGPRFPADPSRFTNEERPFSNEEGLFTNEEGPFTNGKAPVALGEPPFTAEASYLWLRAPPFIPGTVPFAGRDPSRTDPLPGIRACPGRARNVPARRLTPCARARRAHPRVTRARRRRSRKRVGCATFTPSLTAFRSGSPHLSRLLAPCPPAHPAPGQRRTPNRRLLTRPSQPFRLARDARYQWWKWLRVPNQCARSKAVGLWDFDGRR
jgi:hypothetical protein